MLFRSFDSCSFCCSMIAYRGTCAPRTAPDRASPAGNFGIDSVAGFASSISRLPLVANAFLTAINGPPILPGSNAPCKQASLQRTHACATRLPEMPHAECRMYHRNPRITPRPALRPDGRRGHHGELIAMTAIDETAKDGDARHRHALQHGQLNRRCDFSEIGRAHV